MHPAKKSALAGETTGIQAQPDLYVPFRLPFLNRKFSSHRRFISWNCANF